MQRPEVTAEGVLLDLHPAGIASRVLAAAIDGMLLMVLLNVMSIAVGAAGALFGSTAVAIGAAVVGGAVVLAYPIAQESLWNGKTVGKAALGLRVVTVTGGPIGFRAAALRGALLLVDLLAVPFAGLWCLGLLISPRHRRLGDVVAGTMVVADRSADLLMIRPISFLPPPGLWPYVERLDVSPLDAAGYRLVRAALLRHRTLGPVSGRDLVERTADAVALRLGQPVPGLAAVGPGPAPPVPAEWYLLCVAAAYQRRHAPSGRAGPPLAVASGG
jgi:uncharacterized RDD family membrane protein YckC